MRIRSWVTSIDCGRGPLLEPAVEEPEAVEPIEEDAYLAGAIPPMRPQVPARPNYLGYLGQATAMGVAGALMWRGTASWDVRQLLERPELVVRFTERSLGAMAIGYGLGALAEERLGLESARKFGLCLGMMAAMTTMVFPSWMPSSPWIRAGLAGAAALGAMEPVGDVARELVTKIFDGSHEQGRAELKRYNEELVNYRQKKRLLEQSLTNSELDLELAPDRVAVGDMEVARH